MKILFQGDSVTDAGRDRSQSSDMGFGYPKYASAMLEDAFPDIDFAFTNLGISGNRTSQLFDRLYTDAIAFEPDVISILIGINDIWHRHGDNRILTSDAQLELNYRSILTRLKNETNAKIVILAPFYLDAPQNAYLREDLVTVAPIVRRLADEFADVYIPLDDLFGEAMKTQPEPLYYSADGVHPNENGSRFIAQHYADAVEHLLSK